MPNQRGINKVSKGVWLDRKLRDLAVVALKKKGVDFSEAVEEMLLNVIEEQLTKEEQHEIKRQPKTLQKRTKKKADKANRKSRQKKGDNL